MLKNTTRHACCCFLLTSLLVLVAYGRQQAAFVKTGLGGPGSLAVDPTSDALFVAETSYNRVSRFDSRGTMDGTTPVSLIIGQSTSSGTGKNNGNGVGVVSAVGFDYPYGSVVDEEGTLWVVEENNCRITRFKNASTITNGVAGADGVIGQVNLNTYLCAGSGTNLGINKMYSPVGVAYFKGSLWLGDYLNNRVLRFDNVLSGTFTNNPNAAAVYGQPNFNTNNPTASGDGFSSPFVAWPTTYGVFVSDYGNNRVLQFDEAIVNLTGGVKPFATKVVGQTSFTANPSGFTQTTLDRPTSVSIGYDGTLFVADNFNNRVLIYPAQLNFNATPALDVLGQDDFTSRLPGIGPNDLGQPDTIVYDIKYNCLWIADTFNNRIVKYADILPRPQNFSSLTVQLQFNGRTPNALLTQKNATGPVNTQLFSIFIAPLEIEELDVNGTVKQTRSFPASFYNFLYKIDANNTQFFYFIQDGVQVEFALFKERVIFNSAGLTYLITPSTLKISIQITNWNWQQPTNTLRFYLSLNVKPKVTFTNQTSSNGITVFNLFSSNFSITTVRFLEFGTVDNVTNVPITFQFINVSTNPNNSASTDYEIIVDIPHFNSSFYYDPDIGVIFGSDSTGGGGSSSGGDGVASSGDGTTDPSLLPLLALLALIPVAFMLLAVVAVSIYLSVWWWRHTRRNKGTSDLSNVQA